MAFFYMLPEFEDKIKSLDEFLKREFQGYDYYAVFSLSKTIEPNQLPPNIACRFSSTTGETPHVIFKVHVSNIAAQSQMLLNEYALLPSQPFGPVKPKGEK